MDTEIIRALLKEKFSKKPALMDSNQKAVDLGYDYAKAHFDCPLPIRLEAARQDEGFDSDRRQHRRGARLPVRRRHRRRVVSDYARDVVDGGVQELLPEIPA